MKSRGEGIVGYNAQIAVDTTNHLIVAVDVTNVGNDRSQLYPVAMQAREAMDTETLSVIADRGYFNGNQILKCAEERILTTVPKPHPTHPTHPTA